jgi:proteasome accessory factor PafA2
MTVRRVMGVETEFGISLPGAPTANPMVLSGYVVTAYAAAHGLRTGRGRWDYADEAPLRDARGFEMSRALADPSQLTDEDPTMANVVLTNGARLYVDHAHPEYSAPEVSTPRAAVCWDRSGEVVAAEAVDLLAEDPQAPSVNLYKNNTDGKGQSYGTHENYLMRRSTPFGQIVRHLIPFFVARQVVCGAGRVGIGQDSRTAGFQISQRADFFEVEVGLETTLKRPLVNTRDEPHALADRYRRLHVIIGDATHFDVSGVLRAGMTSLVLAMIEDGRLPDLSIRRPVTTLHAVSHDPGLTHLVELVDGRRLTALDLLWVYHDQAAAFLAERGGMPDEDTAEVMALWADVLTRLGTDLRSCAADLDWVAKLVLLDGYRDRDGLAWDDPRLQAIDIQFGDVRPTKGLAHRLRAMGRVTELITSQEVIRAASVPPADTRAYFRGRCLERFGPSVVAASWDSVVFEVPGETALRRVPMLDPWRGTQEHVGDLLDEATSVGDLLARLARAERPAG